MNRLSLLVASAWVFFLAGCQVLPNSSSDPARNYVLGGAVPASATVKPAGKLQLGLRSVELPGYLHNHRDMAVRTAANEIRYDEFSRWAESLEDGVARVLKQRLAGAEGVAGVSSFPFAADVSRDYDLVIRIQNCEGALGEDGRPVARLVATYDVIAAGAGGQVVVRRTFVAPDLPWNGRDFGALAGLLTEQLGKLGDDLVANLPK